MKSLDILRTALGNALRSKLRTTLTVLAIFIGAFTLTLTNGIGAGINSFVSTTISSVGVDDVMTVTTTTEEGGPGAGPSEYDPDQATLAGAAAGAGGPGGGPGRVPALSEDDLATIAGIDGVLRVQPAESVALDFVRYADGTRYQMGLAQMVPGMEVGLEAGTQVELDATEPQLVLPVDYLEPLGLGTAEDAVGRTVTLAVTDQTGTQVTESATVVGVAEEGLISSSGAVPNNALVTVLHDLQRVGTPEGLPTTYASASVWFDDTAGDAATTALKDRLADAGFTGTTLQDQLGMITTLIDAVVLVLNAFAIIALIAASIGIVNTLFMAVQERTREVGLMKALGLSSARVFSLFSVEAVVIGLLGSVLGVVVAVVVGSVGAAVLGNTVLADMPGLTIMAFEPGTIVAVIVGIMAIAFLAGTLPALRAARQDPIASLRYE